MDDPILEELRNAVFLQRAGNSITAEVRERLDAVFRDIVAEVTRIDPVGPSAMRYRRQRLAKLLGLVDEILPPAFRGAGRDIRQRLAQVARNRALWQAETLSQAIDGVVAISAGVVTVNWAKTLLDTDPFGGPEVADTLAGWLSTLQESTRVRLRREIMAGVEAGESIDDLVRRIRGRSAGRGVYVGGVLQTTTRSAEALVRTAVTHVSATARRVTLAENARVLKAVRFVATLDSSTTVICASLDGEEWAPDSPQIRTPPLHINCRSTLLPVVDWEGLGMQPPAPGPRAAREVPEEGSRRGARGRRTEVPSSTTYSQWLRGQPQRVQEEVLGPARARRFRGGMSLAAMVRRDGSLIPLDEL